MEDPPQSVSDASSISLSSQIHTQYPSITLIPNPQPPSQTEIAGFQIRNLLMFASSLSHLAQDD